MDMVIQKIRKENTFPDTVSDWDIFRRLAEIADPDQFKGSPALGSISGEKFCAMYREIIAPHAADVGLSGLDQFYDRWNEEFVVDLETELLTVDKALEGGPPASMVGYNVPDNNQTYSDKQEDFEKLREVYGDTVPNDNRTDYDDIGFTMKFEYAEVTSDIKCFIKTIYNCSVR